MKWVTWEKIGVDRMACAWLIQRFLDQEPEFLFIPSGSHDIPEGAEPFDLPGVRLTHRRGHCTFTVMLKEYQMKDPILHRMARIIDEADTVQDIMLEPVAAGLDFLCRGLRTSSQNDYQALEKGYLLYDALYAQLSIDV